MTTESEEIAAIVDRFPHWVRERLVKSVRSLAEIYRASGVMESPMQRVRMEPLPDNVVQLRRPKVSRGESTVAITAPEGR